MCGRIWESPYGRTFKSKKSVNLDRACRSGFVMLAQIRDKSSVSVSSSLSSGVRDLSRITNNKVVFFGVNSFRLTCVRERKEVSRESASTWAYCAGRLANSGQTVAYGRTIGKQCVCAVCSALPLDDGRILDLMVCKQSRTGR